MRSTASTVDPRISNVSHSLYRLAVKAVIWHDNKILLVRERDDEWWSLPGGGIDHGENAYEALSRELQEELGVDPEDITIGDNVLFATLGSIVNGVPKANLFYRAVVPAEKITPTEHVITSRWFSIDELTGLYLSPSTGPDLIYHLQKHLD